MTARFHPHSAAPRRLLVRGVNWLGDAVMTTPALIRLREALPDTHIALLTRSKLADLWNVHPAIDEVISIEPGASVWSVGSRLRAHQFDTALVLPNSPRSALETWLAGIPRRTGYSRPWRNWLLTDVIPTRPGHVKMQKRSPRQIRRLIQDPELHSSFKAAKEAHQIYEYLHLVASLGANEKPCSPTLRVTPEEIEAAQRRFELSGERAWLGLNPGAEYGPAKRWPAERFIAVAREIQQETGCRWIVFGGRADAPFADEIARGIADSQSTTRGRQSAISVAGQTSLRELMALLKQCRALLTNDTGPMHVAAALGVPVIVPFGSTSPELTGPGLPGDPRNHLIQSDAPCAPCFLRECPIDFRCMRGIEMSRVVEAVLNAQ